MVSNVETREHDGKLEGIDKLNCALGLTET